MPVVKQETCGEGIEQDFLAFKTCTSPHTAPAGH